MIPELKAACSICESGAVIERYKHIIFTEGTLRAFNGVVSVQAPSIIDPSETFAVNEERLAQALRACEDDAEVSLATDFLKMKKGKLTVKVRRLDAKEFFHDEIKEPAKKSKVKVEGLLEALRAVAPFMSSDASRPWTTSILLRDGYAWATNNLSMVRYPLDLPLNCRIPAAAVPILLELGKLDYVAHEVTHTGPYPGSARITCGSGNLRISFPEAGAEWPNNVDDYFKKSPKKLPALDKELFEAARIVEKFADRFVALKSAKVEGKLATIESEYEIEVPNGKGLYPAKLLLLVLNHATHADFSTYPEPIFFAGAKLRGVAVGAREGAQ
jgi:hypothetical protein